MCEIIEQIEFFHVLKLQPVSKKEVKRWEREIENNLIAINNVKECYVAIEPLNIKAAIKLIKNVSLLCSSRLRVIKNKKRCCALCCKK